MYSFVLKARLERGWRSFWLKVDARKAVLAKKTVFSISVNPGSGMHTELSVPLWLRPFQIPACGENDCGKGRSWLFKISE